MTSSAYKPLAGGEEIRLLRIYHSGCKYNETSLQLELLTVPIQQTPPYECVSYTWGKGSRDHSLELLGGTSIAITHSLREALPYLIEQSTTGFLWIDQICINQDDIRERSAQVAVMGPIYRSAERVIVWLGTEASLSNANDLVMLMDLIDGLEPEDSLLQKYRELAKGKPEMENRPYPFTYVESQDGQTISRLLRTKCDDTESAYVQINKTYRDAVLRILELPWFGRAWVLQEALLARDFFLVVGGTVIEEKALRRITSLCGSFEASSHADFPWYHLNHIDFQLRKRPVMSASRGIAFLEYVYDQRHRNRYETNSGLLAEILWQLRGELQGCCEASDPRDIIFCLYGSHGSSSLFAPDYSLDTPTTFERAAKAAIQERRDLKVLSIADGIDDSQGGPHATYTLASWVPDWTSGSLRTPILQSYRDSRTKHYYSCKGYKHMVEQNIAGVLKTQGKVVDSVAFVSKIALEDNGVIDIRNRELDFVPLSALQKELEHSGFFIKGKLTQERVFESMCAGVPWPGSFDGETRVYRQASRTAWQAYCELISCNSRSSGLAATRQPPSSSDENDHGARDGGTMIPQAIISHLQEPHILDAGGTFYPILFSLCHVAHRRRLAITEAGHLGLISDCARPGDSVAVVHGSTFPLLMRDAGPAGFHFVGVAYVEGTMKGEKVDWEEHEAPELHLV